MSCCVGDLSLSINCRVGEYFFCLSVFVCELTFGQLSVSELLHNRINCENQLMCLLLLPTNCSTDDVRVRTQFYNPHIYTMTLINMYPSIGGTNFKRRGNGKRETM